jgi:hypothetical protein
VNKVKFIKFCLAGGIFIFFGCSSEPAKPIAAESARVLETKAQIKTPQDTNTVKIQIALLPMKAARLEITGTLGVSVATVLVLPRQIKIALHMDKTFIQGPANEKTLYPVFKQNISPRLLWKIIHDQNPADANWACQLNAEAKPVSCKAKDGTEAVWTYESPIKRRIEVKNNNFEMTWIFKDQLQMPEYQNETFVLTKPDGYREINIK